MLLRSLTRGLAASVVVALAACAGQSVVPSQSTPYAPQFAAPAAQSGATTAALPMGADLASRATDPCNLGIWYFKGSCLKIAAKKPSTKFALKTYKGITATITWPSSNAKPNTFIIIGEGTNSTDITGTFNGHAFTFYKGKGVKCYNTSLKVTPCAGSALVYAIVANDSKNAITFSGTPQIDIASSGLAGKKKCTLNLIYFANNAPKGWEVTPISAAPKAGKVTIPSVKLSQGFGFSGDTFSVFAITCE